MPRVHFVNEMITVDVPAGTTLRQVAMAQGIELYRGMWTHINCLGNGICGRCRLWVLSTPPARPTLRERAHRLVRGNMRLACQVRVDTDLQVRTRALGTATVREPAMVPSYREQAEQRLREARAAEAEAARKAAEKKAAAPEPASSAPGGTAAE